MTTNRFLSVLVVILCAVVILLLVWREPRTANAAGSNYLLLCSACSLGNDMSHSYTVIVDTGTHDVYAFSSYTAPPRNLGKMPLP